jgi:hypothetical protein
VMRESLMLLTAAVIVVTAPVATNAGAGLIEVILLRR